MEVFTTYIFHQ